MKSIIAEWDEEEKDWIPVETEDEAIERILTRQSSGPVVVEPIQPKLFAVEDESVNLSEDKAADFSTDSVLSNFPNLLRNLK